MIKKEIGKEKYKLYNFSLTILMDKKIITETKGIAENFNKYFTQIGPNLAKDIGTSTKSFSEYVKKHGTTKPEKLISLNQFKQVEVQVMMI